MKIDYNKHSSFPHRWIKISLSLICLLIGGLIYLAYRPSNLLMFDWVDALGLNQQISVLRNYFSSVVLPDGIIYNIPSMMWLFSYMLIIDTIWGNEKKLEYHLYLYSVPVLIIIAEILQFFGLVSGTFDILDIIGYCGAIILFEIIKFLDK